MPSMSIPNWSRNSINIFLSCLSTRGPMPSSPVRECENCSKPFHCRSMFTFRQYVLTMDTFLWGNTMILKYHLFSFAAGCLLVSGLFSSCASTKAVNLNIHTQPEGSYIVYKVAKHEPNTDSQWIYLGVTPYRGITMLGKDAFDQDDTISFRVMRNGYMDQVKEWTGDEFLQEYEQNEVLTWTPRLIKSQE